MIAAQGRRLCLVTSYYSDTEDPFVVVLGNRDGPGDHDSRRLG